MSVASILKAAVERAISGNDTVVEAAVVAPSTTHSVIVQLSAPLMEWITQTAVDGGISKSTCIRSCVARYVNEELS